MITRKMSEIGSRKITIAEHAAFIAGLINSLSLQALDEAPATADADTLADLKAGFLALKRIAEDATLQAEPSQISHTRHSDESMFTTIKFGAMLTPEGNLKFPDRCGALITADEFDWHTPIMP